MRNIARLFTIIFAVVLASVVITCNIAVYRLERKLNTINELYQGQLKVNNELRSDINNVMENASKSFDSWNEYFNNMYRDIENELMNKSSGN